MGMKIQMENFLGTVIAKLGTVIAKIEALW
jgi:hypothetical protein